MLSFSVHVLKVEIDLIMNECDRYIIVSKYFLVVTEGRTCLNQIQIANKLGIWKS